MIEIKNERNECKDSQPLLDPLVNNDTSRNYESDTSLTAPSNTFVTTRTCVHSHTCESLLRILTTSHLAVTVQCQIWVRKRIGRRQRSLRLQRKEYVNQSSLVHLQSEPLRQCLSSPGEGSDSRISCLCNH